jgi:hypothetical protein
MAAASIADFDDKLTKVTVESVNIVKVKIVELGRVVCLHL